MAQEEGQEAVRARSAVPAAAVLSVQRVSAARPAAVRALAEAAEAHAEAVEELVEAAEEAVEAAEEAVEVEAEAADNVRDTL